MVVIVGADLGLFSFFTDEEGSGLVVYPHSFTPSDFHSDAGHD